MKTLEQCTRPTQVGLLESRSKSFFLQFLVTSLAVIFDLNYKQ